jgi:mRNA-degrading endonuclease RelE of RelBE toxin-antitoxin system
MHRPIFRRRVPFFRKQITATLNGEVISFGSAEWAHNELVADWPPEPVHCAPPKEQYFPGVRPKKPRELSQEWLLGFASEFRKAVDAIDRNIQGRVLQAIAEISKSPVTNRGDTVRQLTGDMKGFWRYRIGDFRLVYFPDEATHTVTLCNFASRGEIYD